MNLAYKKILGKFTKVLGFPHVGKNSQIISFFFESVPNQDDLVSEYVELDSSYDVLKSHKMYIIQLKWLTHSHHVI